MSDLLSDKHSRRGIIFGLAATTAMLSACTTMPAAQSGKAAGAGARTTYVLVHGAWHGGWCWRDVQAGLEALGHKVYTPTLTGLADRANELTAEVGLNTHIADIISVIEDNDLRDFVLVGHSYGGMVITGVVDAMKDRIAHIVYLDAALPVDGDTMITQGPSRSEAEIIGTTKALTALAPDGVGMGAFPPEFLGIPKDHPSYQWVADNLTPHPLKTWLDPIRLVNGGSDDLPRTYLHCVEPVLPNASFAYHASEVQADPSWSYQSLPTGHDAMITLPKKLVEVFTAL